MSLDRNKNLVRRIMAALDAHDLAAVAAHCAPDAVFVGWGPAPLDVAGYTRALSAVLAAFGDARFPIEQLVAEGGAVVCRHHLVGTHDGPYQGIEPTGRRVVVPATATCQIEGGRIRGVRLNADCLGLMAQLGNRPMGPD